MDFDVVAAIRKRPDSPPLFLSSLVGPSPTPGRIVPAGAPGRAAAARASRDPGTG